MVRSADGAVEGSAEGRQTSRSSILVLQSGCGMIVFSTSFVFLFENPHELNCR